MLRLARRGYELHVDGGGVWALDVAWRARKLRGRRVIVEGIRSGFDRLDVDRIRLAVEELNTPRPAWWRRLLT